MVSGGRQISHNDFAVEKPERGCCRMSPEYFSFLPSFLFFFFFCFSTKNTLIQGKYLKSVHLKLSTRKNNLVVLSFNAHYQNFKYNSKPKSQKIPSKSIPQSQKLYGKSISQSQKFQAKNYPKLAHIPVLPHSEASPSRV